MSVVARLLHLSDSHVMDVVSPARAEWVELLAHDPHWRPLLHTHRPYEALALFALAAHIERLARDPLAPSSGGPFDLVLNTGDTIDNAQRNELDAYLAVMRGGHAALPADGSVNDPRGAPAVTPWPYWVPDESVPDVWASEGYPVVPDFLHRVAAGVDSPGCPVPWTSVLGNHDLMRQGTAFETTALAEIAVGSAKRLLAHDDYRPDDPLAEFCDTPERFSVGSDREVRPDGGRRVVDAAEWIDAHRGAGAVGYGPTAGGSTGDGLVDLEHLRVVLLDTNHPHGDYQGSIGTAQLEWLDRVLAEAAAQDRLAVIASHHGTRSLVNHRGDDRSRRHDLAVADVAHRHANVVAWLVGHRHVHQMEARPGAGGGFWEITTGSTIDWPCQVRAVEIERGAGGAVRLATTVIDHGAPPDSLAGAHLVAAQRFMARRSAQVPAGEVAWLDRPGPA